MTDVLELKRSNLVLPTSGYELDREEMGYVEGGLYLSHGTLSAIAGVFAFSAWNAFIFGAVGAAIAGTTLTAALSGAAYGLIALLAAIPGATTVAIYLCAYAGVLIVNMVSALIQGKGLDISFKMTKILFISIPTGLNFTIR